MENFVFSQEEMKKFNPPWNEYDEEDLENEEYDEPEPDLESAWFENGGSWL